MLLLMKICMTLRIEENEKKKKIPHTKASSLGINNRMSNKVTENNTKEELLSDKAMKKV